MWTTFINDSLSRVTNDQALANYMKPVVVPLLYIFIGEGLTHVLSKMILATGSGVLTCQYKTLAKGFKSIAFKFGKSRSF